MMYIKWNSWENTMLISCASCVMGSSFETVASLSLSISRRHVCESNGIPNRLGECVCVCAIETNMHNKNMRCRSIASSVVSLVCFS